MSLHSYPYPSPSLSLSSSPTSSPRRAPPRLCMSPPLYLPPLFLLLLYHTSRSRLIPPPPPPDSDGEEAESCGSPMPGHRIRWRDRMTARTTRSSGDGDGKEG
ncbi:hypothetical protein DAI22_04g076500 [Oryza sativa Japonica Group]|nr:hypothetical protein DAI22_04g076500 [Oryza sativa Japonica Group]